MDSRFASPERSGEEGHTEVLPHLMPLSICFIDEQGWEQTFAQFPLVAGRGTDAGWVIPDKNISRHHAQVIRTEAGYILEDLNSLNGVRVNGFKIDQVSLEEGDHVSLADVRAAAGGAPTS